MLDDDFPSSFQNAELRRILSNVLYVDPQTRAAFLSNIGIDDKFFKKHVSGNEPPIPFVEKLTDYCLKEYRDKLDPPIRGFIKEKLLLITFLENLTNDNQISLSEADKDFFEELVSKWRPWFEEKLLSYEESCLEWFELNHAKNRTKSLSRFNRLSDKLSSVEQKISVLSDQLKLEPQVYKRIQSKVEEDERRRKRKRTWRRISWSVLVGLGLILAAAIGAIYFFPKQTEELGKAVRIFFQGPTPPTPPTPTPPTPTPTSPTPSPPTSPTPTPPTPSPYAQGWMFIGKLTRSSSGDDILDPPTIYPRMIPQSGAVVEVRETTHIRFNQPQAPDFDYAQQEILGCVVPGEKVKILQVEIVPNQAVWARVQKYSDNPTFSPRCPSNGVRAWW